MKTTGAPARGAVVAEEVMSDGAPGSAYARRSNMFEQIKEKNQSCRAKPLGSEGCLFVSCTVGFNKTVLHKQSLIRIYFSKENEMGKGKKIKIMPSIIGSFFLLKHRCQ
jgi:hypothetical protein